MNMHKRILRSLHPVAMIHPRAAVDVCLSAMDGMDSAVPIGEDSAAPEAEPMSGVLVLPVRGTIVHHWTDGLGGYGMVTPTEWLVDALDRAEIDDSVSAVVLDVDSYGGMAAGTPEAAERIFQFRQVKPIIGVANSAAYSAGYYLLAACSEVYVTTSGGVGSIGTLQMHEDVTKMLENIGVSIEIIRASESANKARFNPFEPLSDDERERTVAQLDAINARFLADIARFRGVADVAAVSGNGLTFMAGEAVALGLADGVKTLRDVLAGFNVPIEDVPGDEPPVVGDDGERSLPDGVETRNVAGCEVRAVGEGAEERLAGVGVRYGSPSVDLGGFVERFAAGAFDESLATDDIRVQWQHDPRYVFGRVRAGTATVESRDGALRYEATPPNAQWARDAMESIRRGDVDQNSFAFVVPEPRGQNEKWERVDGQYIRTVKKARLIEVGPQTNPAYQDTSVAVRSLGEFQSVERIMARAHRMLSMARREV